MFDRDTGIFKTGGLQREIATYLVVLAIFSIIILGGLAFKISRDVFRKQAAQHSEVVSALSIAMLEREWGTLFQKKRRAGDLNLGDFFEGTFVTRWTLFDSKGRWLAGATPTSQEKKIALYSIEKGAKQTLWISTNLLVAGPIKPKKTITGSLTISYEADFSRLGMRKIQYAILFYALTFSMVLVWFGYKLIRHTVINPLHQIERAAQLIAQGDVSYQVSIERDNEIGRLSDAIESMRRKLISDQEKLADYAQSLETLNEHLKEAQRALLRGEKLASVGRLAAGMAHEVGNPLGAVLGYLSILKTSLSDQELIDVLERSEAELSRISRLVRELLDYSRLPLTGRSCDVNDVVRGTVEAVKGTISLSHQAFEIDLEATIPSLWIDSDSLRQVLWNLLTNARDAVGDVGKVLVKTGRLSNERLRAEPLGALLKARIRKEDPNRPGVLEQRLRKRREDTMNTSIEKLRGSKGELPSFLFEHDGEVVMITVEDDGVGIPPEDLTRIFDPFFTTKPPGKGTGLGLYICANLVESMGGFLDVSSEEGRGTKFVVVFPITGAPPENLRA